MQNTSFEESLNKKYEQLIKEHNYYRLLLSVKTEMRKLLKKLELKEFFLLITWCANVLKHNNEIESSLSLISTALEEYDKFYNKNDQDLLLENLKNSFLAMPPICEKSKLKHKILKFLDSKNIPESGLQKFGYYKIFAEDSLTNKDLAEGYRYALKSLDFEVISKFSDEILVDSSETEKHYFIARLCLELVSQKNLPLALRFIIKYVNESNNFQSNPPILNFAYILIALLSKFGDDFSKFWDIINIYKPFLEIDPTFPKYLNKISLQFYNKAIIQQQENTGMNIMDLLKSLG